ncbi:MAG: YggS family pyridoxal phosphate-dependent enzyme [Myxococcales bacterium]|nr:YggS family pyridoxal phosphate-dependent enzyme [Myxococcales bacterium]
MNATAVLARVRDAERRAGRAPGSVTLVGASKTRTTAEVQSAHAAGVTDFGENYVQELVLKAPQCRTARWHFIGHLQRNKAKAVALHASCLHTLDSTRLADHLDGLLTGRADFDVLLEVNVGGEGSKGGVAPDGAEALAEHVLRHCPSLRLVGLMTIPPPDDAPRVWFAALRELRDRLAARLGHPLPALSMGMSDDLDEAVLEGATFVRVGTALFGPRPPKV